MTFSPVTLPANIVCLLDAGRRAEAAAELAVALDVLPSTAAAMIAGNLATRDDRFPELASATQSFGERTEYELALKGTKSMDAVQKNLFSAELVRWR